MLAVANRRNAGCGPDHAALVEQRQPARRFQHALDHEHHVRAAGVVFVEAERDVVLVGPRQDAVAELGDLQAVADDDGVLADQVDTADVAVEIDAHARPVEARRHLLDVGRFAGAVVAGDDDAAVVGEAGEDRRAWSAGRTGSPDRCPAHARRLPNRPAPPCRCRSRRPGGSTPSCREGRRPLALRRSLILRDLGNDRDPFRSMGMSADLSANLAERQCAAKGVVLGLKIA